MKNFREHRIQRELHRLILPQLSTREDIFAFADKCMGTVAYVNWCSLYDTTKYTPIQKPEYYDESKIKSMQVNYEEKIKFYFDMLEKRENGDIPSPSTATMHPFPSDAFAFVVFMEEHIVDGHHRHAALRRIYYENNIGLSEDQLMTGFIPVYNIEGTDFKELLTGIGKYSVLQHDPNYRVVRKNY